LEYLKTGLETGVAIRSLVGHQGRKKPNHLMQSIRLSSSGATTAAVPMGAPLSISVSFAGDPYPIRPVLGLLVRSNMGAPVFTVNNRFIGGYNFSDPVLSGTITCNLTNLPLMPGTYSVDLYLGDGAQDLDIIEHAISFEILPADYFGTGQLPHPSCGLIMIDASFQLDDTAKGAAETARI